MKIELSLHAEEQIAQRGLNREQVIAIARTPEQIIYPPELPPIAQSHLAEGDKIYLIRVIFRDEGDTRLIITAYKTSNVSKSWQEEA